MAWWSRVKTEVRDAVELVLLPGLAAVLPWSVCFRVFRVLSRIHWLYRGNCEQALAQAIALGQLDRPEKQWLAARRLVTLIDHADYYLGRFRGHGWMRRYLHVQGCWPPAGQSGMLCTFHWGAGMWGLRHAAAHGMQAHALVAALEGAHFRGRSVLGWYARARTAEVARALGHPTLDVSASLRPAVRALRAGEQVLAAVDVPSDQVDASEEVELLGMKARMPRGLLRLAVDQQVPVTVYVTGIRMSDGHRTLTIVSVPPGHEVKGLVSDVFAHLSAAMETNRAAWHFWAEAPRFFHGHYVGGRYDVAE